MSRPECIPSTSARCQAITDIITSVAQEQAALAIILTAEGEKLEKVIDMALVRPELLLETNRSVERLVNAVSRLEIILQTKLDLFRDCLCECRQRHHDDYTVE